MTTLLILLSPLASATALEPASITDVSQRGLQVPVETTTDDSEIDIPLLTPDGNILHLLGTSHPRALTNTTFAEVSAVLVGVTQPDCTAHVDLLVDATTHRSLAQKLTMTCLDQTIRDAFIQNPPLPPRQSASGGGEGRGEGEVQ